MIPLRFFVAIIGFKWFMRIVGLVISFILVLFFVICATLANGLSQLGFLGIPILGGPTPVNVVGAILFRGNNSSAYIEPSSLAQNQIPQDQLRVMMEVSAQSKCGLGWPVLAAIAGNESTFGKSADKFSSANAFGYGQFLQGTWNQYASGIPQIASVPWYNASDNGKPIDQRSDSANYKYALYAMDAYLCALGAKDDLSHALWAYSGCVPGTMINGRVCARSDTYVADALAKAQSFGNSVATATVNASQTGQAEVNDALRYVDAHVPYALNGASFTNIDCSGLTMNVVQDVFGISLPHNAQMQWDSPYITHIPADQAQPGDLVFFWGTDGKAWVSHVGIVSGQNRMINAPDYGYVVSEMNYNTPFWASHFYGIGRIKTA